MNKKLYYISFILILVSTTRCQESKIGGVIHKGNDISSKQAVVVEWDSVVIDAFNTSGRGDYFMIDSIISFADRNYARVYNYDCRSGELLSHHFGLGMGPNELNKFSLATPVKNDSSVFIIDGNLEVHFYNKNKCVLDKKGMMDFGWVNRYTGEYELPQVYNFMLMSDLGANVYKYHDNLVVPIQPITRYACEDGLITRAHYEKSHILGLLDVNTMKITEVFGHYPSSFLDKSMPQFNFFSYFIQDDLFYVNFPTDSLIYVYKYPDQLKYVFGYECEEVNRNYTTSNKINKEIYKDFVNCGMNTGIYHFPELKYICRTYMKDMTNRIGGMQIYNYSYDLIAEIEVPPNFKLLGYFDSCFYGVTLKPTETEENTFVTFYKGRLL